MEATRPFLECGEGPHFVLFIIISLYSIDAISSVIIMINMSILLTVFLRDKLSKTLKIGYHFEKSPSSLHVG